MKEFAEFEREVVRMLVAPHIAADQLDALLRSASFVSYDYTGSGYYFTVRHPSLPTDRIVCDEPPVVGTSGNIRCGFIVFLGSGELTLECHTWGPESVPEDFRKRRVTIATAT